MNDLIKDTVFLCITETNTDPFLSVDVKLDNHKVEIHCEEKRDDKPCYDKTVLMYFEEHSYSFTGTISGLPPKRELLHEINLKSSLSRTRPIYHLALKKLIP